VAFEKTSGDACKPCGEMGCCSGKVMTKLHQLAYEQDDQCCYKESSARVRAAAKSALDACGLVPRVDSIELLPVAERPVPFDQLGHPRIVDKQPPGYPRRRLVRGGCSTDACRRGTCDVCTGGQTDVGNACRRLPPIESPPDIDGNNTLTSTWF